MAEEPESDIPKEIKRQLRILVTGKTGVGKSALVNGIVGGKVAEEGRSPNPQTLKVCQYDETKTFVRGTTKYVVKITIFDSPGLQDRVKNRDAYLEDMRKKCKEVDLILYCIKLNDSRSDADSSAISTLSNAFGMDFWKNTLFVLTFANEFKLPPNEDVYVGGLIDAFKKRVEDWTEILRQELRTKNGISKEVAEGVPVIPAGYYKYPSLPDREQWLTNLWWECLSRTSNSAKPILLEINRERLRKQDEVVKEDISNQEAYKQPIIVTERVLSFVHQGYTFVKSIVGQFFDTSSDDIPCPEDYHAATSSATPPPSGQSLTGGPVATYTPSAGATAVFMTGQGSSQGGYGEPKLTFSRNMEPKLLARWLRQEYGDKHDDDIRKLEDALVNGELFLDLSSGKEILNDLEVNLSPTFEEAIISRAKQLMKTPPESGSRPDDAEAVQQQQYHFTSGRQSQYARGGKQSGSSDKDHKRSRPVDISSKEVAVGDNEIDSGGCSPPKQKKPRRLSLDDSSHSVEHETAVDLHWCTEVTRLEAGSGAGPVSGTAAGVAVLEALWDKKKLGVKFIGNTSLLDKWRLENGNKMTTETIIDWANTWWRKCDPSNVPRFVDVDSEPGLSDDIRVEFNDQGTNCSVIGMQATQFPNQPTMHLSLVHALSDGWKKFYIIHEFGHALGLGHEHQRSKFWEFLKPHVCIEKMRMDLPVGGDEFYSSDLGGVPEKFVYDPQSIMHYRFKVEWLDRTPLGKDYSDLSNIERDHDKKILSDDAYAVLKGVHESGCPRNPSDGDISFLKQCYVRTMIAGLGLPSHQGQSQQTSQNQEDIQSWSVEQVVKYFESTSNCKPFSKFCQDQEIDGDSLLNLSVDVLKTYEVKAGLAVKVMRHVKKLSSKMSELSSDYDAYLEKVDKSHFHVFEIPDDCTNLSDLKRQVMPTYCIESGYGYHQYVKEESVDPNEQILLYKNGEVFKGYKAYHLMKDGQDIKLADTKWKNAFVQSKFDSSFTPGSLFLYYNPHSGCSSEPLSEEDSSDFISHYHHLLSTPNIVSLSCELDDEEENVLNVGVIDSTIKHTLSKSLIFETPKKWFIITVETYQEGAIKAVSGPCIGGFRISTRGLPWGGTLGICTNYLKEYRILSAAHVLTNYDDTNVGKEVYCESDNEEKQLIGTVEGHEPVKVYRTVVSDPEYSTYDLAWVRCDDQRARNRVLGLGRVLGIDSPRLLEKVQFCGASSNIIKDINVRGFSCSGRCVIDLDGDGSRSVFFYKNAIKLGKGCKAGDSGSAVVSQKRNKVVGILMCSSDKHSYACRLKLD